MADKPDAERAYLAGLQLLAMRELSEAQVRLRLQRRRFPDDVVDTAIARLLAEGAIDDARTARAIARTAVTVRGLGRRRVRLRVDAAGIDRATADAAIDDAFADVDGEALLQAALARRLRGRTMLADHRERARLFRYLVSQGFDGSRVTDALRTLPMKAPEGDDYNRGR